MKLARVLHEDRPTLVLETDDARYDLAEIYPEYAGAPAPTTLTRLLARGQCSVSVLQAMAEIGKARPQAALPPDARRLAPVQPGKVVCVGRNYAAHVAELGHDMPEEPTIFGKRPDCVIGPGEAIRLDAAWGRVDYEGELALVMGQEACRLREEEAEAAVAGYTLLNDVTARDLQKAAIARGNPWYLGKNLDTFCPLGPAVLPRDAWPWPPEVDVRSDVNGEPRQDGNTRLFLFKLPALLAYITRFITLRPGDVVATGTPKGVGPLQPGDTVTVSVDGIGELRNPVEAR